MEPFGLMVNLFLKEFVQKLTINCILHLNKAELPKL